MYYGSKNVLICIVLYKLENKTQMIVQARNLTCIDDCVGYVLVLLYCGWSSTSMQYISK